VASLASSVWGELDERQHRNGVEEVDADVCAHLRDGEARGVRREHAVGAHVLGQLCEDLLLEVGLLEDRLEHEVAVREVLVARRGGDKRAQEVGLALVVASFGDLLVECLVDGASGRCQRFLAEVAHCDRDLEPSQEERRQLGGHQARAHETDLADRSRLLARASRWALRAPLDQVEGVERGLRLPAGEELADGLFLGGVPLFQRPAGEGAFDQLERLVRGRRGAVHLPVQT
jgi:hypothetical protein